MQYRDTVPSLALALAAIAWTGAPAYAQTPGVVAAQETYQLVQVNGSALPVVAEEEDDCREEITGTTLTLETDGRWVLQVTEREVCGADVQKETEEEEGRYTLDGSTIRFDLEDDGDEAEDDEDEEEDDAEDDEAGEIEVDDLAVGTRDADSITVRLEDGRTTLLFRR